MEEIFDAISYAKGSCVIRMLHDWIGVEDFRTGLGNYLKKFAYKNARTGEKLYVCILNTYYIFGVSITNGRLVRYMYVVHVLVSEEQMHVHLFNVLRIIM